MQRVRQSDSMAPPLGTADLSWRTIASATILASPGLFLAMKLWIPHSILLVTCVLLGSAAGPLSAQVADPDPKQDGLTGAERVNALIERVRLEQARVQSLEADFVQIKESSMLAGPVEARGLFSFSAPDRVRWDYLLPDPIAILISDEVMTTWYQDIDQAEKVHVGRQSQRVLEYLGAGSSMDELMEYFTLTLTMPIDEAEPYYLQLDPLFDKVAKRIKGMSIWVDPQTFLPVRLRYYEADGDITDLSFDNVRLNLGVPEDRFVLELPTTVQVRQVELDRPTGLH